MLAADSLPHKLETKRRKCIEIERVLSEPVVSEEDLEGLRRQLEEASTETQRLMEKRMPGSNSIQVHTHTLSFTYARTHACMHARKG